MPGQRNEMLSIKESDDINRCRVDIGKAEAAYPRRCKTIRHSSWLASSEL